jgi:hypothetical protein
MNISLKNHDLSFEIREFEIIEEDRFADYGIGIDESKDAILYSDTRGKKIKLTKNIIDKINFWLEELKWIN